MRLVIGGVTITPGHTLKRYVLSAWKCEIMKCTHRFSTCRGTEFGVCYHMHNWSIESEDISEGVSGWLIACSEYRSEIYL